MSKWTLKDLENIAKLAKLSIQDDEAEKRLQEFTDVLDYIAVLSEVELPKQTKDASQTLRMREDASQDSLTEQDVFKNAPSATPPFFFIPKVIDGGKS